MTSPWVQYKARKPGWYEFTKNIVPDAFKTPVAGKFAISTRGEEETLWEKNKEFYRESCMVIDVKRNEHGKLKVDVIWNEEIAHIKYNEIDDWLFFSVSDKLANKNIAITGITTFPRETYKRIIEINGGTYKTSVGKKTTYLINSSSGESTKIKRAKQQGVQLISELDFFKMIL